MQKQLLQAANWKKPEEKVVMSMAEALQLVNEARPHVQGTVVGEHPKLERLAHIIGVDLGKVS